MEPQHRAASHHGHMAALIATLPTKGLGGMLSWYCGWRLLACVAGYDLTRGDFIVYVVCGASLRLGLREARPALGTWPEMLAAAKLGFNIPSLLLHQRSKELKPLKTVIPRRQSSTSRLSIGPRSIREGQR